jgi:hypothetical protein
MAERFGYKVHVGLFDNKVYEKKFFDVVRMIQVINIIMQPITMLRGMVGILKRGGTAILSTPNAHGWGVKLFGKRWMNWYAPYHLQFFTPKSMRLAAEKSGLVLARFDTVTNSNWLHYQRIHLATYPVPGKPLWFWSRDIGDAALHEKAIVKVLSFAHRSKLNHVITRDYSFV